MYRHWAGTFGHAGTELSDLGLVGKVPGEERLFHCESCQEAFPTQYLTFSINFRESFPQLSWKLP